jgi:hypothetical protein
MLIPLVRHAVLRFPCIALAGTYPHQELLVQMSYRKPSQAARKHPQQTTCILELRQTEPAAETARHYHQQHQQQQQQQHQQQQRHLKLSKFHSYIATQIAFALLCNTVLTLKVLR